VIQEYILQRFSDNRESTLGVLFKITVGNPFLQGYTLEDEYRDAKVKGETRIPAGRYEIVIQKANTPLTVKYRDRYPTWFKYHLMLKDVPNFQGIYIHIGNRGDNTDGCILVGDNLNNNKTGNGEVSNSTACFMRLYSDLYGHLENDENKAFINIRDEKHLLK
jgi:hypothetical protein